LAPLDGVRPAAAAAAVSAAATWQQTDGPAQLGAVPLASWEARSAALRPRADLATVAEQRADAAAFLAVTAALTRWALVQPASAEKSPDVREWTSAWDGAVRADAPASPSQQQLESRQPAAVAAAVATRVPHWPERPALRHSPSVAR
jgi:hypothetical protein